MKTINNSCGKKKGCDASDNLPFDSQPIPMYGITEPLLSGVSTARSGIRTIWLMAELPVDSQLEKEGPLDKAAA